MIELGQKVKDIVSEFTGIAVARTEWLNGCARIAIAPKVNKDGSLPDTREFDEPQIRVVDTEPIARGATDTGGPLPFTPSQNKTPARR